MMTRLIFIFLNFFFKQPFSSGRQVVVERHNRDQGLRKEWHGGASSHGGGFAGNRRMGETRGSMMAPPSRYY